MSYEYFLANRIAALTTRLNNIEENAKENQEFDNQEDLENDSKIRVSFQGNPYYITIEQLLLAAADLVPSSGTSIERITLGVVVTEIVLSDAPDDVTVNVNKVPFVQGTDYALEANDASTKKLTFSNSLPAGSKIEVLKIYN